MARVNNPQWVQARRPLGEVDKPKFNWITALELLLAGYGAYCLWRHMSNFFSKPVTHEE